MNIRYSKSLLAISITIICLSGCGGGGGNAGDTSLPAISNLRVVSPAEFTFAGGDVTFAADVTDSGGVAAVGFVVTEVGGDFTHTATGVSGGGNVFTLACRIPVNTRNDGQVEEYAVTVTARDSTGNQSTSAQLIVVIPAPEQPPVLP